MVSRDDEFAAQRLPETAARGGGCPTPARWRFCNRLLVTPDALSMCCDRLARCGTGDFHLGSASLVPRVVSEGADGAAMETPGAAGSSRGSSGGTRSIDAGSKKRR